MVARERRTRMLSGVVLRTKLVARTLGLFQRGVRWVNMVHIGFKKF
jgi:hypothetical protein